MDDKKLSPTPEGDTSWLDEILEGSNYGDDILNQMQPLPPTKSSPDLDLDKILEEMMSRAEVLTFGDLDFMSVWFSLVREKGTFKGRQAGRSRLWDGVSVWQSGQVLQFF